MAGLLPVSSVSVPARSRSSAFSLASRAASSARRVTSSSRSDLNGFSMKSYAPCWMAATAVSMVPWPLIITTGTCGSSVWMVLRIPNPSSRDPCSHTSNTTSDGRRIRKAATAASESPAWRTV